MGSSYGEKREIHVGPASTQEIKGIQVLLKDLKSLQQEGGKSGDLKFHLKDGHCVKAHSLIIKARYVFSYFKRHAICIHNGTHNFIYSDVKDSKEKHLTLTCLKMCLTHFSPAFTLGR